jgi:hypothetical protein
MSNGKGWPDAANPGFPTNSNQEGPHSIIDQYGQRRWYFWMPVGTLWFSGSFQCSPSFAAIHWSYIGAAITPRSEEKAQFDFPEEDVWSNYNYREDVEGALKNLVHEIVRSRGISEVNMDMHIPFDRISEIIIDAFHWLAGTAVLRRIIANEFGMPAPPPDFP